MERERNTSSSSACSYWPWEIPGSLLPWYSFSIQQQRYSDYREISSEMLHWISILHASIDNTIMTTIYELYILDWSLKDIFIKYSRAETTPICLRPFSLRINMVLTSSFSLFLSFCLFLSLALPCSSSRLSLSFPLSLPHSFTDSLPVMFSFTLTHSKRQVREALWKFTL